MTRKPGLSAEDRDMWSRVTRNVRPLGAPRPARKPAFHGQETALPLPAPYAPLAPRPPEQYADRKMRRGQTRPERVIDLHDLTHDQALALFVQSLHLARRDGERVLLVITGKGSVLSGGVLRRAFPEWLARADIAPMIASYSPAHIRHGGGGAFYVRLRRG